MVTLETFPFTSRAFSSESKFTFANNSSPMIFGAMEAYMYPCTDSFRSPRIAGQASNAPTVELEEGELVEESEGFQQPPSPLDCCKAILESGFPFAHSPIVKYDHFEDYEDLKTLIKALPWTWILSDSFRDTVKEWGLGEQPPDNNQPPASAVPQPQPPGPSTRELEEGEIEEDGRTSESGNSTPPALSGNSTPPALVYYSPQSGGTQSPQGNSRPESPRNPGSLSYPPPPPSSSDPVILLELFVPKNHKKQNPSGSSKQKPPPLTLINYDPRQSDSVKSPPQSPWSFPPEAPWSQRSFPAKAPWVKAWDLPLKTLGNEAKLCDFTKKPSREQNESLEKIDCLADLPHWPVDVPRTKEEVKKDKWRQLRIEMKLGNGDWTILKEEGYF